MATKRTVILELKTTGDNIEKKLNDATNKASGLQNGLKNLAKTSLKGLITAVTAVTTALVAGTTAVIKYGSEFETSLSKVSTLFGNVNVDTKNLSNAILDLSNSTGISATELNEGLYQALSAGVEVTEDMTTATDFLTTASKLAKGGFTDLETAVDATTSIINAYGMTTEDMTKVSEILIKTQNKGKTTVAELGASISQVTPTAAAMGVEFEQVGTALALMTAQGTPTAQATTQLNSLFAELGKTGTTANKALKETYKNTDLAGKSFQDMMKEGIPLSEILADMSKHAEDNNLQLLDMFSSIEAGKSALSISKDGKEFVSTLSDMRIGAGQLEDAYTKMADTFETQSSKAREGIKNLGISIYDNIKPALKDTLKEVNSWIQELSTAFEKNGIEGLTKALGSVLGKMLSYIVDKLPDFINMAIDIIKSLVKGIKDNVPLIAKAVVNIFVSLTKVFFELLPQILEIGLQLIIELAKGLAKSIPQLIPVIVECIKSIINTIVDNLPLIISAGIDLLLALILGIVEAIPDLIDAILESIGTIIAVLLEPDNLAKLIMAGIQILIAVITGIIQAIPQLIMAIPKIFESMITAFKEMDWKKIGKNILSGIVNGFLNIGNIITNAVKKVGNAMLKDIKKFFGIASPSKLMKDIVGKNLVLGISTGIDVNTDKALKSINNLNKDVENEFSKGIQIINPNAKSSLANAGALALNSKNINSFTNNLSSGTNGSSSTTINIVIPQQTVAMADLNGNAIGNIVLPQITKKIKLGGGNV